MAEISVDLGRRVWWVDAFLGEGARGNPAVVVLNESDLSTAHCQQIASELSVAETAFLRWHRDGWELRCFTPTVEVGLFGHATLAAVHVLFTELRTAEREVVLATGTGPVLGRRAGRELAIELPRHEVAPTDTEEIRRALGPVQEAWTTEAGDVVALLSYDALCDLDPDTVELFLVPASLVVAVAEGGADADVVLRVFAPRLGVREDAATGRAMCALSPIWQERTGSATLRARQLSTRGGVMAATLLDDHVEVMGRARTFLSGELWA